MPAAVVGQLTRPRSDSDGVSAGPVGDLIGGYDGATTDLRGLATTDGRHFRVAAWPKVSRPQVTNERGSRSMSKTPHATPQRGY